MIQSTSCDLHSLLATARELHASDVIIVVGNPPCIYLDERLQRLDLPPLTADDVDQLIMPLLNDDQRDHLQTHRDVDLALNVDKGRFRLNVHYQRGTLAAAIRLVRQHIPDLGSLNLPDILHEFAQLPQGLLVVSGATGQGKSTTLAALIEHINTSFHRHIITLEDPIEYVYTNRKSIIEQREIGEDAPTFPSALRHILRQKPDVILVGEMRDQETMATALAAAETGQLVLATLHTASAAQTVERIVDSFEGHQQQQIRVQLAGTLQAVVAQMLFKDVTQPGMIPACEILSATTAVRRAIRDNETHLIPGMMQTGAKYGMQLMDQAIVQLVQRGRIDKEEARLKLLSGDDASITTDSAWGLDGGKRSGRKKTARLRS